MAFLKKYLIALLFLEAVSAAISFVALLILKYIISAILVVVTATFFSLLLYGFIQLINQVEKNRDEIVFLKRSIKELEIACRELKNRRLHIDNTNNENESDFITNDTNESHIEKERHVMLDTLKIKTIYPSKKSLSDKTIIVRGKATPDERFGFVCPYCGETQPAYHLACRECKLTVKFLY